MELSGQLNLRILLHNTKLTECNLWQKVFRYVLEKNRTEFYTLATAIIINF